MAGQSKMDVGVYLLVRATEERTDVGPCVCRRRRWQMYGANLISVCPMLIRT